MSDNTENFIISREIDMGLCVYESEHECTRYCADFRIFSIFHEKYQQIFENSQLDYLYGRIRVEFEVFEPEP